MTRYADPERCPDCQAAMPFGSSRCPSCGLSLEGPLAARLFTTLASADELLRQLRATSGAPVPAGVPAPGPAAPVTPAAPAGRPERVRGASVPKILLGLGALCLLVAALVFLAVAWSAMGVAGRTATLVGFTLVAAGLAAWAARRDLRSAAESLSVVALGLLSFDLVGARDAGWLGDIGTPGFFVILGTVLALVGSGAAIAVRRTPAGALTGAEVVAALGVLSAAIGAVAADWFAWSAGLTLAVVLLGVVAALAIRARLTALAVGSGLFAVSAWVVLAMSSWDRAITHASLAELWADLEVWPLLAGAALAGALVLTTLPLAARLTGLSAATLVLSGVALAPFTDETITVLVAAGAAVLVVLALLAAVVVPQPWRRALAAPIGLGVLWMAMMSSVLAAVAAGRLVEAGTALWSGAAGDSFPAPGDAAQGLAAWLLPVMVIATGAGLVAVGRSFSWADRLGGRLTDPDVLLTVVLATGALTLALFAVPLYLVMATLLVGATVLTTRALRRRHALPLTAAVVLLALALLVALHAPWLTLTTLVVALGAAGTVHLRHPRLEVSVGAGAVVAGAGAALVWTAGSLADARGEWTAVVAVIVLAALALGAPYGDERLRVSGPATYARLGTETGAFLSAAVVSLAGVEAAATASEPSWTAVYLTLMGAAASAMALLRPDRRYVGWLGGLLLAAASWVRLADLGVDAPEAYTLPSALALLAVGLVHLRRTPAASTFAALSPGLALALVPSLLWVLAEPIALRSALLGLACLGLVVGGVRERWGAPFAHGAIVGTLLVLRLATPYAEAVPRWALIGAAGALLVTMGITWERRVRDARAVAGYVRGLR